MSIEQVATERVEITNARGQRIVGVLHGEPKKTAVICCHGMLSNKDSTKHTRLAETLARKSIAALRFDFAGRGESEGSLFELSYSNEVEDLDAVISFVAEAGVEAIGLFGSSMGGTVALLAAARDERVKAVATLAAAAYPAAIHRRHGASDWLERGYIDTEVGRIGKGLYEDALEHNVLGSVGVLRAPILVLHGEVDEVVPVTDAHDIATAARDASLEMVFGADHRFSDPVHLRPAVQRVADFLTEVLQAYA